MHKLPTLFVLGVLLIRAAEPSPAPPLPEGPALVAPTLLDPAILAPALRTPGAPLVTPVGSRNLWHYSLAALAASNTLDIQSSWGKHELNPGLSGTSGIFGAQGALLKIGLQGGLVGVEYLLTRHRPSQRLYRLLAIINFGASAGFTAVAAHNYTVAPPSR